MSQHPQTNKPTPVPVMTYSLEEVAGLFRRNKDTFRELRPRLEANGFPLRLPGTRLWSRPAVDRWFVTDAYRAPDPEIAGDNVRDIRDHLEVKYGGRSA